MNPKQRNALLAAVAVVLLAVAGFRMLRSSGNAIENIRTYTGYGVCLACKQESVVSYGVNESQPLRCEACGEQAFYLWWYCNECKYRFIPDLVRKPGQPPRPNPYPRCTHCGCADVSGWDPENPYQTPAGDAELPDWP